MTGQTLNGTTVNGHKPPRVPVLGDWQPIHLGGIAPVDQPQPDPQPMTTPAETAPMPEPAFNPVALAEADRIRKLTEAEAEELRITNERKRMRLEKDQADHAAHLAKKAKETADADAAKENADKAAADEKAKETARSAEQQRTESWWKWGARGIYAVGLAIAAPVQFLDFWDKHRPFLVAAPALLEGFALVLACGAAWAVAHRRDVRPYRVGIMLGASIAAAINLRGGLTNPAIGLNAGIIGAIASLGGPIVLMAYEHGIAQKADGIPSRRETRAAAKQAAAEQAARDKARADREAAAKKAADEKKARDEAAESEQKRRDADRKANHEDVWTVAEALRSARGSATVTEQIWGEAWLRVTGSKLVGVRPEMEAQSRVAQERMKAATDNGTSLVESQMSPGAKREPNAPDGRRNNGGTPPRRTAGDTAPYHPAARLAASDTARRTTPREDA